MTEDEVFDFWKPNLVVAYIKDAESTKIDFELGLQRVMTEGWKDGDSPYARLEFAGVIVE